MMQGCCYLALLAHDEARVIAPRHDGAAQTSTGRRRRDQDLTAAAKIARRTFRFSLPSSLREIPQDEQGRQGKPELQNGGSVLIWALLCIFVVLEIAFQSFEPSVGSYFVSEGSRPFFTENVSVSYLPIDNSHFVSSLVAFGARCPLELLGVGNSSALSHSKWNCGMLNGLSRFKIRDFGEALYHLKFSNHLFYPRRGFPRITTIQYCIQSGSAISIGATTFKHLEPSVARFFRVGLYIDHNPSPFDSSTRAYLYDQPNKQENSEESDYRSRECVQTIRPYWQVVGAIACGLLIWVFAWPCVNDFVDGGWRRTSKAIACLIFGVCSVIAAAIFASGKLCLICTESGCENQQQRQSFHSGNTVPHNYFLTSDNYWGTVIDVGDRPMANVLSTDKQVAVISVLAEGSGIRHIEASYSARNFAFAGGTCSNLTGV